MLRKIRNILKKLLPWNWFQKKKAVGIIILDDFGEVLLLKRSKFKEYAKGKWETPGGALKNNETHRKAVDRILKEQLGVKAKRVEFIYENQFSPNEKGEK